MTAQLRGGPFPNESSNNDHVNVLGVRVSAITMRDAVERIDGWIARREHRYVCITGVHGVMESQRDPALRDIHNAAGMVTPDGMPLVWLSHLHGFRHVERVYGPDLLLSVCAASVERRYRHFFYGGAEGVPELLTRRLQAKWPGLRVAGTLSPPFHDLSQDEDEEIVRAINEVGPDIVWVGLSTPKQERWMASHIGRIKAPVMVGVGAAFDFHAGLKRQAPHWMQVLGMEWLFRTLSEPRRLGPRYLRNNPAFLWSLVKEQFRSQFSRSEVLTDPKAEVNEIK